VILEIKSGRRKENSYSICRTTVVQATRISVESKSNGIESKSSGTCSQHFKRLLKGQLFV